MSDQALSDLQAEVAALKAENAALKAGKLEADKPLIEGHPKFQKYPMWVTNDDKTDTQLVQTEADHKALGPGWGVVGTKPAGRTWGKTADEKAAAEKAAADKAAAGDK